MFSFVDQITTITGGSVRGRFAVPDQFEVAPDWLISEAIGQLAAWVAMRDSDFSRRPVGATVGAIDFAARRRPHGVIDLSATIERTDRRAVLYSGSVCCGGAQVVAMQRCIGPLLPMEVFEDADCARARFASLTGPEPVALWSADDALPKVELSDPTLRADDIVTAEFRVAEDAELFDEHFPRQPVVPATMLIEAMCRVGAASVECRMDRPKPVSYSQVKQVKVRQFTKPGQTLRIEAKPADAASASPEVLVTALNGDVSIASVRVICAL